jgi:hypothetical protein
MDEYRKEIFVYGCLSTRFLLILLTLISDNNDSKYMRYFLYIIF